MLARLNALLLEALASDDPAGHLRAAADDPAEDLAADERAALRAADPDGLLLTRRLVQKLRFEQLLLGDPALNDQLDADPEALLTRFQRYDRQVPNAALYPREEAAAFHAWLTRDAGPDSAAATANGPASPQ